jgi:hypothetical protein
VAEEQAPAELRLAPDLLRQVSLRGRLVTGEALDCQHALGAQIRQAHGHLLFVLQLKQAELLAEVRLRFDQPPPVERCATARRCRTQRDRHAVRTRTAAAAVADYLAELGGMGARQVLRLESGVTPLRGVRTGPTRQLVRSLLTRRGPTFPLASSCAWSASTGTARTGCTTCAM